MEPSRKKIIVVVGATGNQGSSVAHTFLAFPNWHVRCLTRNPSSAASEALRNRGAEIVTGDLAHALSLDEAFRDANAIFLNTDYWGKYAAEAQEKGPESASQVAYDYEVMSTKNAVTAAAGVPSLERFVYSAFASPKKGSNGKYSRAFHFEAKASIVEYIENEQPELAKKSSFIYPCGYNDLPLFSPTVDPSSGKYSLILPVKEETRMPTLNPRETMGPLVKALIEEEAPRTKLLAYESNLTMREIVTAWSKASGKEAILVPISMETFRNFPLPVEALDAVGFCIEYSFTAGIEGVIEPSQLKTRVHLTSFEAWLKARDWEAVLAA